MAVPLPVTKTIIDTGQWGIPLTNEVNALRTAVTTLQSQIAVQPRLCAYATGVNWGPFTAQSDIPGSLLGFTGKANRVYHFQAAIPYTKSTDGNVSADFTNGAGGGFYTISKSTTNGWTAVMIMDYWVTVPVGSVTYKVRIGCNAGSVSAQAAASSWTFAITEWPTGAT